MYDVASQGKLYNKDIKKSGLKARYQVYWFNNMDDICDKQNAKRVR